MIKLRAMVFIRVLKPVALVSFSAVVRAENLKIACLMSLLSETPHVFFHFITQQLNLFSPLGFMQFCFILMIILNSRTTL